MTSTALASTSNRPLMSVLGALSVAHLLNDLIQSMIPAIYPVIKDAFHLDFAQIGLITHLYSLLVPALGKEWAGLVMGIGTGAGMGGRMLVGALMPAGANRRWSSRSAAPACRWPPSPTICPSRCDR